MLENTGTLADTVNYEHKDLPWYLRLEPNEVEDEMFESYLNTKPRLFEANKDEPDYSDETDNTEDFDVEKSDDKILKYLYDFGTRNKDIADQKAKVASSAKEVDEQFQKMSSTVINVCKGRSLMKHAFIWGGAGIGKCLEYSEPITIQVENNIAEDISQFISN